MQNDVATIQALKVEVGLFAPTGLDTIAGVFSNAAGRFMDAVAVVDPGTVLESLMDATAAARTA